MCIRDRCETANTAMSGIVASYYDQHDEEYLLCACFPETVAPPDGRAASRMQSDDVLAATAEHCARDGLDPAQVLPAEEHFRARDEIEREAVRATV
eukprot:3871334-Alexandrium_andersonii.AAC.1